MLKTQIVTLSGKDEGRALRLIELPAFVADRAARAALRAIDADLDGSVAALALQHTAAVRALGPRGNDLLLPFIDAQIVDANESRAPARPFDIARDIRDWRNVERLQHAALLLHVGFLIGREPLAVPVAFQADQILHGGDEIRVTFCSPHIAAVLESGKATYRELETVLSIEDVFNLVEVINVAALKEWAAHQRANKQ